MDNEIEGPLLTYDQMSGNDSLSCINSLVTKMIVIDHRNIPCRAVAASGADVATGHGGGAGPASSPWLAHREQWTVDGTEFQDAEVACGSWTRVLRSQVSLPPPVAVVMERLPNDRALFHKETFWH